MRTATVLTAILSVFLLATHASTANAQPLFDDLPTLEWRTATADLIITARLLDFEVELRQHSVMRLGLTLGPIETIKGKAAPVIEVSIDTPGVLESVAEGLAKRRDSGTIDAWFLAASPDTGTYGPISHDIHATMLPLTDWPTTDQPDSWQRRPLPPAVTMDFVRHDGRAAILDALRRIMREEPPRADPDESPPAHGLQLALLFHDRLWPENANPFFLTVPADARLEALARRMIEHPASHLDPLPDTASERDRRRWSSRDSFLRHKGAKALAGHFQNEENARLLATLLDDPTTSPYRPSGIAEPTRHLFTTRKIAWDALTQWGFDAPEPILERPMVDASIAPSPDAVRSIHGPRGEGIATTELLFEIGGDHTPELLRLYFHATDQPTPTIDLERLRTDGVTCLGFSVFSLVNDQAVLTMHAGGDTGPITLTLERPDWHTRLVVRENAGRTEPLLYGQWDTRGEDGGPFWEARTGTWNTKMHRFDTTTRHPPIRFIAMP